MSQQNLLGVGFDVNALSAEAQQVLAIVEKLYAELKKYDGMKISPISAGGMSELVAAAKAQQTSIESLNKTVSDLALATRAYNQVANETAAINAKIAVSSSDVAKANAAAKVQLQENNKALMDKARLENDDYQLRKGIEQEEKDNATKALAEKKKNDAAKTASDREYTRTWNRLLKERDAEERKAEAKRIRDARAEDRRREKEGQNALKQNDLLAQLKLKQADLQTRIANAELSGGVVTPQSAAARNALVKELTEVNTAIASVNSTFEKAGSSGAAGFGRTLNGLMGPVRQLAYILPGLGIAGIFNLAFEAIGKAAEAMGLFNSETEKAIEEGERLLDHFQKLNKAILDRAEALSLADKAQVDYFKNQKEQAEARGENFAQTISETDAVLNADKELAEQQLKRLGFTQEEYDKLNNEVNRLTETQKTQLLAVIALDKEIEKIEGEKPELTPAADEFGGQSAAFLTQQKFKIKKIKDKQDEILQLSGLANKQYAADLERFNTLHDARKAVDDADQNISIEALKRSKYFADEYRQIVLSNALYAANSSKEANEQILNDDLKTTEERIAALKEISNANIYAAKAKYENVVNTIGVSQSAVTEALNDYNMALLTNENNTTEKLTRMTLDFYLKKLELNHQQHQTELLQEQLNDKELMDNDQEGYSKRLGALMEYTNDREEIVWNQYMKEVDIAKKTLPKDLLDDKLKQLFAEYQKQIADIENGVRKEAYQISQSWFAKQQKLIKEQTDYSEENAKRSATKELTELNEQFADKEISYRKFARRREALEYESAVKIKDAKIKEDTAELERLEGLQKESQANLGRGLLALFNARNAVETKTALGQIDAAKEQVATQGKAIGDKRDEIANTEYQKLLLTNKAKEDAIKQTNANWMQLEQEAVNGIQTIVDQAFDQRIAKLNEVAEAYQHAADMEIDAIERSTLSAKEKNAYEIQLNAQKEARERKLAEEVKKISHDKAVFDKAVSMAQIILNTTLAVTGALAQAKTLGIAAAPLAISYAAVGAAQLAIAAATQIPEYAEGGIHKKAGLALFGEAGSELVREPGGKSYIADKPTIKHLEAGTQLIPLYNIPSFSETKNESWAQTMYLGKQIAKSKREIKNIFKPKIIVDLNRQIYINRILHG